ncbi:MAG: hypothetical protein IT445_02830 [Phycisphaeraceae bacterium]|nr:hypothetical protein [Phycisphaeraceae bacterium]
MKWSALLLLILSCHALAEPVQIEAVPTRIAMFKNGYGLIISEARLPAGGESFVLSPLPRACFGTLWLGWPGLEVTHVRSTEAWVRQTVSADQIEQTLREKFGADADFDPAAIAVTRRVKQPALAFDAAATGSGTTIYVTYLAQGIAWSPSYSVHLSDNSDDTATLSAKAVVVNDLLDLESTDVDLIAGYPNLQFAQTPSAMSPDPLPQLLNQLRQAGQSGFSDMESNLMRQSVAYERGAPGRTMPSMPGTPIAGEDAEDLYFYHLPDVTLKSRERGYYPLFSAQVPAEHVFTWDIPDFLDANNIYRQDAAEQVEAVWHALKLTNNTDAPWTTGAAVTFSGERLLGQDTLHFVPPKASTRLRITQAVSIDAEQNEYEIERQRNAANFHGYDHDLVTIRGELKVTSYKNEPADLIITKLFSGELLEADGEPQNVTLARGLRQINPRGKLEWTVTVPPGKDHAVTLNYSYKVYTRR